MRTKKLKSLFDKTSKGYIIDREFTEVNKHMIVLVKGKKCIIIHKCWDRSINDSILGINLILISKDLDRLTECKSIQKKIEKKYGIENVITIGHCMGGFFAENCASKGCRIITLNKLTPIKDFAKIISNEQIDLYSENDYFSKLIESQTGGKRIKIKNIKNIQNMHSINCLDNIDIKI